MNSKKIIGYAVISVFVVSLVVAGGILFAATIAMICAASGKYAGAIPIYVMENFSPNAFRLIWVYLVASLVIIHAIYKKIDSEKPVNRFTEYEPQNPRSYFGINREMPVVQLHPRVHCWMKKNQ